VLASADKARALRLERLERALSERLEQPPAALETLIFELKAEEWHPALWEALHAAALRDAQEAALAKGYSLVTAEHRLKQLPPRARAELLMHAADFYEGIAGDAAQAQAMLELVLQVAPGEPEAYARLEMRFQAAQDRARLLDLYSWVASSPPKPPEEIAREALGTFMHLPQSTVISDQTCMKLLPLAAASTSLLDAVVAHCRKTDRVALACEFLERAIAAAERLLGSRDVASRAAALLKEHRRARSELEARLPRGDEGVGPRRPKPFTTPSASPVRRKLT